MSHLVFREGVRLDLDAVLEVQREAFTRVSRELGIPPDVLPPLTESLVDLHGLFDTGTRFFVAVASPGIVGSVRATMVCDTVEIGRLVVATAHVRQGVATGLMRALEDAFTSAERFELFTGFDARAPLALYEKLGYRRSRTERVHSVELVWLEKRRAQ